MLCQLSSLKAVSKHGAGERSTQDQTGCLLREQYIASAQALCRKSFTVGTFEQQGLYSQHNSTQKNFEKEQLKGGFKKKKFYILVFSLCFFIAAPPSLSQSMGGRLSPRNTENCRGKMHLNWVFWLSASLLQYQCLSSKWVKPLQLFLIQSIFNKSS